MGRGCDCMPYFVYPEGPLGPCFRKYVAVLGYSKEPVKGALGLGGVVIESLEDVDAAIVDPDYTWRAKLGYRYLVVARWKGV